MLPLVMLPGMMCTGELYREQLGVFSAERAVQFLPLNSGQSVHKLAEQILLHAPAQFALCGLSMGGIVAFEVLRQAPERVKGLALLDTNPLAERDEIKQKRAPQIVKVQAGALLEVMRDEMKPNYLAENDGKKEVLDLCLRMALQLGSDVFISQSIALRDRPDQCDTLRSVAVPTLVMCGEQDKLCPVERHQMMHQMVAGSTLAIVQNAGHLPVLEQPKLSNEYLQAWLKRCDHDAALS